MIDKRVSPREGFGTNCALKLASFAMLNDVVCLDPLYSLFPIGGLWKEANL